MLFEILDEGKALKITATDPAACRELVEHYKLDPFHYAAVAMGGHLEYIDRCSKKDNETWFQETVQLGPEWLAPYMKQLERWFGYTGPIPLIENAPIYGGYPKQLCHTHMVERAMISPDGYWALGYQQSRDYNGKPAEQRSRQYFHEYVQEDLGDRRHEPEYLALDNGLYRRNPNYLKSHHPHPAAKNERITTALVQWWVANVATPGQKACLEEALATHRSVCKNDSYGGWLGRSSGGIYRTWEKHVKWEEFRSL